MSGLSIATILDTQMLEVVRKTTIATAPTLDSALPLKNGSQIADELGGRYLLRYMLREQVGRYTFGSADRHCVTPTPYRGDEVVAWLNLPRATGRRAFVLLLNPIALDEVLGPRWIAGGGGIEYILPKGFSQRALVFTWELQVG